jgi:hypothetical protein
MAEQDLEAADPLDPNDLERAKEIQRKAFESEVAEAQTVLRVRREAYGRLFKGNAMAGDAQLVLADLMAFCRGNQTPWDNDPRIHALLTGRYEVFHRIQQHLKLSFDEHWLLVSGDK